MIAKKNLFLVVIFVFIYSNLSSAQLKSDFDSNGNINISDLLIFSQHWLDLEVVGCIGDTDDDCDVDFLDFSKLSEQWQVSFELDLSSLSYYDVSSSQWYAEPGIFEVQIGSSSRNIRLTGAFELF